MNKAILFFSIALLLAFQSWSQPVLIPYGSTWTYLDNGSNQDTAWRHRSFNDSSWKSGEGLFGYGIAGASTTVSYGPDASHKYITTYFRKEFSIGNPALYPSVRAAIKRDDGVIVYINDHEVYRNNMPPDTITYTTLASGLGDNGKAEQVFSIKASAFTCGKNILAVEVHQQRATSSDLAFDLELAGNVSLTRGPYLQAGNGTGVTVRWRTDMPTNSSVQVGTAYGTYGITATDSIQTTEHVVRVNGLHTGTKYFYRFGSSEQILQSGIDNFFTTAPSADSAGKVRVAVFGDCGRDEDGNRTGSLNAYLNYTGSNPATLMLLLGDNAYYTGTDAEFQAEFFEPYSTTLLKNHILFPVPGNHDYYSSSRASRTGAYYKNFTMPTAGECGGVASGTEAYYSYDWGNVHFISMDSHGTESPDHSRLYDTLGAQVTWLKKDLAANTKPWVIVCFHHPPYTMGGHNSDKEDELVKIRENFIPILERFGVDLVLNGHSHDYERSYLLDHYYGAEKDFDSTRYAKSTSSGKNDGSLNSAPYVTETGASHHGTVYVVTGSAGASGAVQSSFPHAAMPFSYNAGGMFYIEVEGNRLDAQFLRKDGVIADRFTIIQTTKASPPTTTFKNTKK